MKEGRIVGLDSIANLEKSDNAEYNRLSLNMKSVVEEPLELGEVTEESKKKIESHSGDKGESDEEVADDKKQVEKQQKEDDKQ